MFMLTLDRYAKPFARAVLMVSLALATLRAAEIEVLPVGPYGQQLKGCSVARMAAYTVGPEAARVLKDHFQGMIGRDLPYGDYELVVVCGAARLSSRISVDRSHQLKVAAEYVGMMYEGDGPSLTITMDGPRSEERAAYWVELVGVYNGARYTAKISRETGAAEVRAPATGSYVALLLSSTGRECTAEVDLVQFTRHWTLHPLDCALDVDRYAHLVTKSDKLNGRQGGWYLEMQKEQELLERQLREAAEGDNAGGKR